MEVNVVEEKFSDNSIAYNIAIKTDDNALVTLKAIDENAALNIAELIDKQTVAAYVD